VTRKFLVPISLPADPTAALEAATKQYVDNKAAPVPARLAAQTQTGGITVTDWNNALESGWYDGSGATNAPPGEVGWMAGEVVVHRGTTDRYLTQTVWRMTDTAPAGQQKSWRRQSHSSVWTPWFAMDWAAVGGFSFSQDAAPTATKVGQTWFQTSTGRSYVWEYDGDSTQWVQFSGGSAPASPVIYGGEARPAPDRWMPMYPLPLGATGNSVPPGRMVAARIRIGTNVKTISAEVSTAAASSYMRVAVYDDSAYPYPGALITQSADISCTTTGLKDFAVNLTPGFYWLAAMNTSPTNTFTLRGTTQANPWHPGSVVPYSVNLLLPQAYMLTGMGTTVPSPWPTNGGTDTGAIVFLLQGGP